MLISLYKVRTLGMRNLARLLKFVCLRCKMMLIDAGLVWISVDLPKYVSVTVKAHVVPFASVYIYQNCIRAYKLEL